jgi:asparagine synthetase B (glutamine-hydrolysing)
VCAASQELRHINTGSDSEVMLNLFASALFDSRSAAIKANGGSHLPTQPLEPELVEAVRAVMARCVGGYSVVATVGGYGLVCWRDPNGIRPLSYGRRKMDVGDGFEYMVVSESGEHPSPAHAHALPFLVLYMQTWHTPLANPLATPNDPSPPTPPLAGTLTGLGFEMVGDVPPGAALLLPRDGSPPRTHNCLSSAIEKVSRTVMWPNLTPNPNPTPYPSPQPCPQP